MFTEGDSRDGFSESAVISDSLWHKMFGGDPNVLGTSFRLDTDLYTIVGIMPPEFHHPGRTLGHDVEVWVACGFAAAPFPKPPVRTQRFIPGAIARLKPGLSVAQAQAKLDAYAAQSAAAIFHRLSGGGAVEATLDRRCSRRSSATRT